MKIHKYRERGRGYAVCIHLDTARVQGDGSPDPAWCLDLDWSKEEPRREGETAAEFDARREAFRGMIQRESVLLARAELARRVEDAEGAAVVGREGAAV